MTSDSSTDTSTLATSAEAPRDPSKLDLRWLRGVLPMVICIGVAIGFLVWRFGG